MSTATRHTLNGVDLEQLTQTVDAIKADPALAAFRFRAKNRWLDGGHSQTTIQGFWGAGQEDTSRTSSFVVEGDEPAVLLGSNVAPNAVETVLHALASCLAVGVAYNAAASGIEVTSIDIELEGELDLRGFLALSPDVRPGYQDVRAQVHIACDAPTQQVDELLAHVQRTSPVVDVLRHPVNVSVVRA